MIAVTFRIPTGEDLDLVAARMRAMDKLECRVVGRHEPREALAEGVASSLWAYAAIVDNEPQCVFGVASDGLLGEEGAPWMLCADGIERHARALLICSKRFVGEMATSFERLANVVHAHNRVAIRYLKWCGFEFGETIMIDGEPFLCFEMTHGAIKKAA